MHVYANMNTNVLKFEIITDIILTLVTIVNVVVIAK